MLLLGAAHPRSRGENVASDGENDVMEGSSPLTRGKRLVATLPKMDPRLIPAHAGKT